LRTGWRGSLVEPGNGLGQNGLKLGDLILRIWKVDGKGMWVVILCYRLVDWEVGQIVREVSQGLHWTSKSVDAMLGGGICTQSITEVFGSSTPVASPSISHLPNSLIHSLSKGRFASPLWNRVWNRAELTTRASSATPTLAITLIILIKHYSPTFLNAPTPSTYRITPYTPATSPSTPKVVSILTKINFASCIR
jgi:hypothetical protein